MSDSWEWVERQQRRERQRKWLSLVGLIVPGALLFYALRGSPLEMIKPPKVHRPSTEPQSLSIPPATSVSTNARQPVPTAPDISSETANDIPVLPSVREQLGHLAEELRRTKRLRPTSGGTTASDSGKGTGTDTANLPSIREQLEQPGDGLSSPKHLRPTSEGQEKQHDQLAAMRDTLRVQGAQGLVSALIKSERTLSASNQQQLLSEVTFRHWMELAVGELDQASPQSSGFSEGWLPVAATWRQSGNEAEAREAIRRAREALPRMTSSERAIESAIDLCISDGVEDGVKTSIIEGAIQTCDQVSAPFSRRRYLAHLSGLAGRLGDSRLSAQLLERAISPDGLKATQERRNFFYVLRARAAAWHQRADEIEPLGHELARKINPKQGPIANCFAHAAMAATRHADSQQFYRMMFKAEAALSTRTFRSEYEFPHAERFAEAYLLKRQWRNAVTVANNIPDPRIQASILFRVLAYAPQYVPEHNLSRLFESFSATRWATMGTAGYVEYRLASGHDAVEVLRWIQDLPDPSLRGAAYVGIARAVSFIQSPSLDAEANGLNEPSIDVLAASSLIAAAEHAASQIQHPLDSAYAWLEIARICHLTARISSYDAAMDQFHASCFAAWREVWKQRPLAVKKYNDTYYYKHSRRHAAESEELARIIDCERNCAALQADLGDATGGIDTCLKIANHAGYLDKPESYVDWNYLFIEAILARLQPTTGIGTDVFLTRDFSRSPYTGAMLAAWTKNIPQLEKSIDKMRTHRRKPKRDQLAHAYGELAMLFAERGDIERYREARRSAYSQISQGQASSTMKCVLATADAIAYEFALAEDNIVGGTIPWFGNQSRAQSQIAISLAKKGRWEEAMEFAKRSSGRNQFNRMRAMAAAAQARGSDVDSAPQKLLQWVDSIDVFNDRVAALCGLALAAEDRAR